MNINTTDERLNGTWKDYTTGYGFYFKFKFNEDKNEGYFETDEFPNRSIASGKCYASNKSLLTLLADNPDGTVDSIMAAYEISGNKLILIHMGGNRAVYEKLGW